MAGMPIGESAVFFGPYPFYPVQNVLVWINLECEGLKMR